MRSISLLDYGAGNLHSLAKALTPVGDVRIDSDIATALDADLLVLPGVGAFGQAAAGIAPLRSELKSALAAGHPCIGVCLGMQMLFDSSDEGPGEGIGLIAGKVRKLEAHRIPQMGWNSVDWISPRDRAVSRIAGESKLEAAYFANAFVADPLDDSCILAWTTHESDRFPSAVRVSNTVGIQFHPEKSSRQGVGFLRGVAEELLRCR